MKIWRINTKYNILYVHGQNVPGPTHCYVRFTDTKLFYRRDRLTALPPVMPTFYADDVTEPLPEEIFDEKLYKFTDPTIVFPETEKLKQKKK